MAQKERKEASLHGFTLIELTVNLQPDVDTEDVRTLVSTVTSSEYAQALLVLGFEACALDVGLFIFTLNCFKGAMALQNLQVGLRSSLPPRCVSRLVRIASRRRIHAPSNSIHPTQSPSIHC
jgi:hypothetical protein